MDRCTADSTREGKVSTEAGSSYTMISSHRIFHNLQLLSTKISSVWGPTRRCSKDPSDFWLKRVEMAASIAMITSVTNAGWQLQSHRWADIFVDLVIAVVLLYLCTCAPSAARRGSELATRLAHVLLVLVFAGWQLLRSPAPLQHTFVAAPLHLCGDVLVSQLFMAASSLPMYSKLSILAVSSATHLFRPYLLEASQEALAIILAGLIGALYGEASTSALRALRQKVESSKARRQADSRLLHAIKGQCGSAAAVLREVARSRQAAAASTDDVQTDSIELELLPDAIKMLAQVSEL